MEHHELEAMVMKHDRALFGNGDDDPGMVNMVKDMHRLITEGTSWAKVSFKMIITLGAVAASVAAIIALLRGWKP